MEEEAVRGDGPLEDVVLVIALFRLQLASICRSYNLRNDIEDHLFLNGPPFQMYITTCLYECVCACLLAPM